MWHGNKRKSALVFSLVGLIGLAFGTEAHAFYWPEWPGVDGTPIDGSVPPVTFEPNLPTVFPPVVGGSEPPSTDPPAVPEPSTLIAALAGLSAAAGYRRWRKHAA